MILSNGYYIESTTEKEVFDFVNKNGAILFDDDVYYLPDIIYSEMEKSKKQEIKNELKNPFYFTYFIKKNNEIIGAYITKALNEEDLEMWVTAILPEHRRKGIYKELLQFTIEQAKIKGFQKIISQHAATNNPIIIAKLKAGFSINGFLVNDKCGMQVTLVFYFNQMRNKMFQFRVGRQLPDKEMISLLKL